MTSTTRNTCPGCGATLDTSSHDAMCPACLMSGALRARTSQGDASSEAATLEPADCDNSSASSIRHAPPVFELPHDLGDYTLISVLGQGGMGTVYEAVQRSTRRRLALKLLAHNLDTPEMRQRFLREGRLAARVNHPASLYVFGSEEIDGIPVITMEIAAGGTLQNAIDDYGPLPITEAVDAVLNMIDGLEAALDRGVLHRDIKPSNCFRSPDGSVKVGDFGLSVSTLPSADTLVTEADKVMGTPAFASPEQLRGDAVDVRSDIYAVGATLFTLLAARAPFQGENAVQVVANVIDQPPASLPQLRNDLPPGLDRVIARCLAKESAGRYRDYAALRNALLPFSSIVPEPATQAQRTAAGWVDYLLAFLPTYAALMIAVGPEALFVRPMSEWTLVSWRYHILIMLMGVLYFTVTEGIWGFGLGKWIMNLRIVRSNGRTPDVGRALLRIVIPIATIECTRIPLSAALLPQGDWSPSQIMLFSGLAILCPWVVALLWLPARPGNGFATAWDLATGTRVVVRPRTTKRPLAMGPPETEVRAKALRCIGPFCVSSEIEPGQWLAGHDPVLRRSVWLIRDDGPLSDARRVAARQGRLRWLQDVHCDGELWHVFEAPRGTPLPEQLANGPVPWSTLRHWLHDLADELWAAQRDGTRAPRYSMAHVWITDDGRAMLLDAPWPLADSTETPAISAETLAGQQQFLHAIADHADPLSVPLHAQPVLHNLQAGSFEKLTFLTGTLRGLLNKPADLSRGLRSAAVFVIPCYAWVATMLGVAGSTDPSVGSLGWAGRVAIAGLVMLNLIALCDFILAPWSKSTGLTTFGLEAVTERGRASRIRMLVRSAVMWLPVVIPTSVVVGVALTNGTWVSFATAATLGAVALAGAGVCAVSAVVNPARGLHDRLAGVWIGRR